MDRSDSASFCSVRRGRRPHGTPSHNGVNRSRCASVGYIVSHVTTTQSNKRKGTGSMKKVRFLGLDVHADTIAVAVAEPDGEVRSLGIIPNREESVRKLVKKLAPAEQLQACYKAGPTGYSL